MSAIYFSRTFTISRQTNFRVFHNSVGKFFEISYYLNFDLPGVQLIFSSCVLTPKEYLGELSRITFCAFCGL